MPDDLNTRITPEVEARVKWRTTGPLKAYEYDFGPDGIGDEPVPEGAQWPSGRSEVVVVFEGGYLVASPGKGPHLSASWGEEDPIVVRRGACGCCSEEMVSLRWAPLTEVIDAIVAVRLDQSQAVAKAWSNPSARLFAAAVVSLKRIVDACSEEPTDDPL